MNNLPRYVLDVLKTLETGGHKAYLVGGCLRDMLLNRPIHDWDVATSALGAEVVRLFPKTVETGLRFGTVTVISGDAHVEVTTFRSESAYSDLRRPESVLFIDDLVEDLKRRDFTMNAMAMALEGLIIDPFNGRADIEHRLIRCVGIPEERFSEDALRMFRALRFSAQLSFDIESATTAAIEKCAPLCGALSDERVRDETEKILMSDRPELAGTAVYLGLYVSHLRKADKIPDLLLRIAKLPKDRVLRWAAFCAAAFCEGLIDEPARFLRGMRLESKVIKNCAAGAIIALRGIQQDVKAVKRILADVGVEGARCAAAAAEVLRGVSTIRFVEAVIASGECFSIANLAVSGGDLIELGIEPGVQLGDVLRKLLEHVIDNPEDNRRELLLELAQSIRAQAEAVTN